MKYFWPLTEEVGQFSLPFFRDYFFCIFSHYFHYTICFHGILMPDIKNLSSFHIGKAVKKIPPQHFHFLRKIDTNKYQNSKSKYTVKGLRGSFF